MINAFFMWFDFLPLIIYQWSPHTVTSFSVVTLKESFSTEVLLIYLLKFLCSVTLRVGMTLRSSLKIKHLYEP